MQIAPQSSEIINKTLFYCRKFEIKHVNANSSSLNCLEFTYETASSRWAKNLNQFRWRKATRATENKEIEDEKNLHTGPEEVEAVEADSSSTSVYSMSESASSSSNSYWLLVIMCRPPLSLDSSSDLLSSLTFFTLFWTALGCSAMSFSSHGL